MNACGNGVSVMLGGGIESTHLVRLYLDQGATVTPVHLCCGLIWDQCESEFVHRFCAQMASPRLNRLIEFSVPLGGFLQSHWAITGKNVPQAGAAADELEIPLRNLTLLAFAVQRLANGGPVALAMGTTADNCYRDGSRQYFDRCQELLSIEANAPVSVLTPLIGLTKTEVIRACDRRTLAASFSCVDPQGGRHCGACIKCGRRRRAFIEAGVEDPTIYARAT
jgi:7-cyano-7-deazaguanine synthase